MPVLNFILDNQWTVGALATAFVVLAAAMNLNVAFDAITIAFNTFKLVTIPSAIASMELFRVAVTSPMVLGAIGVGAALIALGLVLDAANKARDAVEGAKRASENLSKSSDAIKGRLLEGTKSKDANVRQRSLDALVNLGMGEATGIKSTFATGGFTGRGGVNDIAGIVHKGEYVVPKSQVDQNTGLPVGSGSSPSYSFTFNIGGNVVGNEGALRGLAVQMAQMVDQALHGQGASSVSQLRATS